MGMCSDPREGNELAQARPVFHARDLELHFWGDNIGQDPPAQPRHRAWWQYLKLCEGTPPPRGGGNGNLHAGNINHPLKRYLMTFLMRGHRLSNNNGQAIDVEQSSTTWAL
jgi:hypothetical protein